MAPRSVDSEGLAQDDWTTTEHCKKPLESISNNNQNALGQDCRPILGLAKSILPKNGNL
ncbi:predicted protein [Botrytis cinerea T4]|uniref:Uncharacterized protein n=1 Tax=Botryotinia fuckeliana (strain T4) TaxID=999810 RepID=G2Y0H2_BOTF4|nr:predicted protein [Botrytis cinerea T4]